MTYERRIVNKKYVRKNKKMLGVYLEIEVFDFVKKRAELQNITLTMWIKRAIYTLLEKENTYL